MSVGSALTSSPPSESSYAESDFSKTTSLSGRFLFRAHTALGRAVDAVLDRNCPSDATATLRARRRIQSVFFLFTIVGSIGTAVPFAIGDYMAPLFYMHTAVCACMISISLTVLARGQDASSTFVDGLCAVVACLIFVSLTIFDIIFADTSGSNYGIAMFFFTAMYTFMLPVAFCVACFLYAAFLSTIRIVLADDLVVLAESLADEAPPTAVNLIILLGVSACVAAVVITQSIVHHRTLANIDEQISRRDALRAKLQAIKLKTGYKEEEDDERVELAAERVVDMLRDIRSSLRNKHPDRKRLAMCIDLIASNKLYDADTHQVKDKETANWLDDLLEVDKTKRNERPTATPSARLAFSPPGATTETPEPPLSRGNSGEELLVLSSETRSALRPLPNWSFDVWDLEAVAGETTLSVTVNRILEIKGLYGKLSIDRARMGAFLRAIEGAYDSKNPYHNAVHGADVAHANFWLINNTGASRFVSPLEHLACTVASALHDVKHPGVNNNFLSRTMHPLAVQYNDKAVLENMHAAEGLRMAHSAEFNIFGDLAEADRIAVRKLIIELVLATDMSRHFELINVFRTTFSAGAPVDEMKDDDRLAMMRIMMKMADVSNPAKPVNVAVKWTERVIEEFFNQGDQERAAGLQVSPFMDRATTDVPKTQVGFISFMIAPLYDAFHGVFPIAEPVKCIEDTKAYWEKQAAARAAKTTEN